MLKLKNSLKAISKIYHIFTFLFKHLFNIQIHLCYSFYVILCTCFCKLFFSEIGDFMKKLEKMAENATKNTQKPTNTSPPKQIGFTETFKRELKEGFKELEQKSKKQ